MGGGGWWKPIIRHISNSTLRWVELTWSGDGVGSWVGAWQYWSKQVETSLTRTMGLLRYIHRGDLKLQNKCDDGIMSKVSRSEALQWDQLMSLEWNNCYSFYFKIGFENDPHENMGRNFSSLSIFRTFQTKVQTSNVWIVIMLQLLIKLKSLMSLNFPDGHKRPWHNHTTHRSSVTGTIVIIKYAE